GHRQPAGLPERAEGVDPARSGRPDAAGRAVPGRARRLASRGALAVRGAGQRAVGAGHHRQAARALRGGDPVDALRRLDRAAVAGDRRRAAHGRGRAVRAGRDRAAGDRRGRRVGTVRLPVPGVRGPGAAAAQARPAPAHGAVAAAAAGGAPAPGRQRLRLVPDRAGDHAGVPAGRLRRARAGRDHVRPAVADGPRGRGRDPAAVALRPVAAVRLRRHVPVRGRRAAGRAPGAGAVAGHRAAGRAARPGRAARAARRRRGGRGRGAAAAAVRRPPGLLGGLHRRPAPAAGRPDHGRGAGPGCDAGLAGRAGGGPAGDPGTHRRRGALDRDRGRRPGAGRARRAAPHRGAGGVHRAGARPARRPRRPLRAHPRSVPRCRLCRPAGAGSRSGGGDAGAAGVDRPGGGRRVPARQGVGSQARGADGLLRVVEQLAGAVVPASALETTVLPSRVADYSPALLDELTAAGEVTWTGAGALPGGDGWLALAPTEVADLLLPAADPVEPTDLQSAVLEALAGDQALFFRTLSDRVGSTDDPALVAALWELVWAGLLTNDTLAPLRSLLGTTGRAGPVRRRSAPRSRYGRVGRPAMPSRTGPPTAAGRWSRVPEREGDPTRRAHAQAEVLLDRHGVLTRGAVMAERVPGGFAAVYPVLRAAEESGRTRRGYFVESLGAAQFASPGAVDRLRS